MSKTAKQFIKVVTPEVRFNYVNFLVPRAVAEGEEARYSGQILIDKEDKEFVNKINQAIEEAKKAGAALWGGKIPEDLITPLKDGDIEKPNIPEYAGHFYLNAASKQKPGVVDRLKKEIVDAAEVYSGCYGRAILNFYPFSHKNSASNNNGKSEFSRGIGVLLVSVQKLADGGMLGRTRPEDDFEAVEDEEDILG